MTLTVDQTIAELIARAQGTPYTVERTSAGARVSVDLANLDWAQDLAKDGVQEVTELLISFKEKGRVAKLDRRQREIRYNYGSSGLIAGAEFTGDSKTKKITWATSKAYEFTPEHSGAVAQSASYVDGELRTFVEKILISCDWHIGNDGAIQIAKFVAIFAVILTTIAVVGSFVVKTVGNMLG